METLDLEFQETKWTSQFEIGERKGVGEKDRKNSPSPKRFVNKRCVFILANKRKHVAEKAKRQQEIIIIYSTVAQFAVGGSLFQKR